MTKTVAGGTRRDGGVSLPVNNLSVKSWDDERGSVGTASLPAAAVAAL